MGGDLGGRSPQSFRWETAHDYAPQYLWKTLYWFYIIAASNLHD